MLLTKIPSPCFKDKNKTRIFLYLIFKWLIIEKNVFITKYILEKFVLDVVKWRNGAFSRLTLRVQKFKDTTAMVCRVGRLLDHI